MVAEMVRQSVDMSKIEKRGISVTTYQISDDRRLTVRYDRTNGGYTVYGEYRRMYYGATKGGWGQAYRWMMEDVYTNHHHREDAEYAARRLYREIVK